MKLEELFNLNYDWSHFFWLAVLLVLLYVIILFARKVIASISIIGRFRGILSRSLDRMLILYEPVSLFILISVIVMIKPAFHGLIIGMIVLLGFTHLRNYVHGRLVMTARALQLGRRITIEDQEGIITNLGRLGIEVRSDDGLHFMPYHILVTRGYVLSSGEKIGGYYNLSIRPEKDDHEKRGLNELFDILMSSPYLDGDHKPEISRSITAEGTINVKLLVKEESHLFDLIAFLEECGYRSQITKK